MCWLLLNEVSHHGGLRIGLNVALESLKRWLQKLHVMAKVLVFVAYGI